MVAHRVETTLQQDGTLLLDNLPFHAGETIEIIIRVAPPMLHERTAIRCGEHLSITIVRLNPLLKMSGTPHDRFGYTYLDLVGT